jgi:hypothetical protein
MNIFLTRLIICFRSCLVFFAFHPVRNIFLSSAEPKSFIAKPQRSWDSSNFIQYCYKRMVLSFILISLRLGFRRNFLSVLQEENFFGILISTRLSWRTNRKFLRNPNLNEIKLYMCH